MEIEIKETVILKKEGPRLTDGLYLAELDGKTRLVVAHNWHKRTYIVDELGRVLMNTKEAGEKTYKNIRKIKEIQIQVEVEQ